MCPQSNHQQVRISILRGLNTHFMSLLNLGILETRSYGEKYEISQTRNTNQNW